MIGKDNMDDLWKTITALRHKLHKYPELSGQEFQTKECLKSFICMNTQLKIRDKGTWFYALYEPKVNNGASPIAFRADMDALPIPETISLPYGSAKPNIAHKCGHDGHCAVLAAVAVLLEQDLAVRRPVYLIFQSAEETGQGGKTCADFVSETDISEVYAFHNLSGYPENAVMVRDRLTQCASKGLLVQFTGESAHAGTPENGRNPASALGSMALYAEKINKESSSCLCTVVSIQEGSRDFGISPGQGEIAFTLRAEADDVLENMDLTLRTQAEKLTDQYGLTVSFEEFDPFPATINHPRCAEKVRRTAAKAGYSCVNMKQPWRPSEDFGWYTKIRPGAMFYVGSGTNWPMPHQPAYDFNDHILPTAATVFLKLAESET